MLRRCGRLVGFGMIVKGAFCYRYEFEILWVVEEFECGSRDFAFSTLFRRRRSINFSALQMTSRAENGATFFRPFPVLSDSTCFRCEVNITSLTFIYLWFFSTIQFCPESSNTAGLQS